LAHRLRCTKRLTLAFPCVASVLSLMCPVSSAEPLPPRLYDVTTETGMPHLEENLRYSITHEKRCLTEEDFSRVFPVLAHPALAGCRLALKSRTDEQLAYRLTCAAGNRTTGQSLWELDEHHVVGTLYVKLGGKNMTFYQRVTGVVVAACPRS
jgi:hypothetical protein